MCKLPFSHTHTQTHLDCFDLYIWIDVFVQLLKCVQSENFFGSARPRCACRCCCPRCCFRRFSNAHFWQYFIKKKSQLISILKPTTPDKQRMQERGLFTFILLLLNLLLTLVLFRHAKLLRIYFKRLFIDFARTHVFDHFLFRRPLQKYA